MQNKRKHNSDQESGDESETAMSDEEGGIRIDDIYIPPPPRPPGTIDSSGPRLIIAKIVNTNFKSYGEVQILGPFHKNFNAIIGPNGSGKSNVIDSLLFVFGYRASKVRSKKLTNLLHKSERYQNVQSCTVAVHFVKIIDLKDDPDAYEKVPNSDFVVSRSVHKDGSSYYQVNDTKVQYKEVASLLRKHGIDLDHNRFLILQGEVESISLMKPKAQNEHETGMLEYLEDIIGTTRFKEPMVKLSEKIELLSEQRNEKLNRVKLAEREKNDLKEPMLEAIEFLKLENKIITKMNFLYQRQINQLEIKVNEKKEEKGAYDESRNLLQEKLKAALANKITLEAEHQETNKSYDDLMKKRDRFQETVDSAINDDVSLQEEAISLNKRRKKLIELLKEEKAKLESYEKVPERNQTNIEEYEGRQVELEEQSEKLLTEKNELMASLRDGTAELLEKKEKIQTKLLDLRKVVDDTKSAYTLAESELKLFVSKEESERKTLETLKTSFEENKQKLSERSGQLKELKQKLPQTEKQLKDTQTELAQIKLNEAKIINEIKVKRIQVQETRTSMQANRSNNKVLSSLMEQKAAGKVPGLFGRLGDLGAIDQKYDVAVSTACGPLDNIVVDSVDTAQWCIEFLKQHDIGRATFIALEKQEHLRALADRHIETPEAVPLLFSLIRVSDPRVRVAFFYALRHTLLAHDLEQATRIAYGHTRYRVVTLKGDLIETSGTMSGGGRNVCKGRMGQSVTAQTKQTTTPRKIEEMEASLEILDQKAREYHDRQLQLEEQVGLLQTSLRQMRIDHEKFTMELQSLQQQQPKLTEQLKKQEHKVKTCCVNPAQVKQLQKVEHEKKVGYDEACAKSSEMQAKVDDINKDIKEKTDKVMNGINKKINDCSQTLEKCKAEVVKLRVAIKTAERNTKKSQEKIANMEQEKIESENKLHQMQETRKEIEVDAAQLMDTISKIDQELEEQKATYLGHQERIAKLTGEINKYKAELIDLDQNIKKFTNILKEREDQLAFVQIKLSKLALHEIPDKGKEELRKCTEQELRETDTKEMEAMLRCEEEELKGAKPNLNTITVYKQKEQLYLVRVEELEALTEKRQAMRELKETVRRRRQEEFHAGFLLISTKLKEMYQLITLGGDADLEMVDSYDPFLEGIWLNVRPPKKSWKHITNLSGGEKTLSSLALVFALHYYKPSPLYFMDEIDAALDFKNVSIVGNYIKERTKNAQFIIISLRSNMFELSDRLVGIYKTYNITKAVAINPRQFHNDNNNEVIPVVSNSNDNSMEDAEADNEENRNNKSNSLNDQQEVMEQALQRREENRNDESNSLTEQEGQEMLEVGDSALNDSVFLNEEGEINESRASSVKEPMEQEECSGENDSEEDMLFDSN